MDNTQIREQIKRATKSSGKKYHFNEKHDKTKPLQMWFQDSEEGKILFIVFYTQACRWSQCLGCNLPSTMSKRFVHFKYIAKQIDYVFSLPKIYSLRKKIKKVILSNNGSILDSETFSSTALMYLMAKLNIYFPNLAVISVESRPEYADLYELQFIARALEEGETPTDLEIAIGFEAFDDKIRNKIFRKGLSLKTFESFVKTIKKYGFRLKCYFMQKPVPGMSDEDAIEDIKKGIDYLDKVSRKYHIKINMHINPTYVAGGTTLEEEFKKGKYSPPKLTDVAEAVKHGRGKHITIFIGLYDEGLAVKGGSFIRKGDKEVIKKLELFNRTQDYSVL